MVLGLGGTVVVTKVVMMVTVMLVIMLRSLGQVMVNFHFDHDFIS